MHSNDFDQPSDPRPSPGSRLTVRHAAVALFVTAAALWFLHKIVGTLLVVFTIFVLAIVLNAPVSWLVEKGWKRSLATLTVMLVVLGVVAGIIALIVPRISEQVPQLVAQLPELVDQLEQNLIPLLSQHLDLDDELSAEKLSPARLLDSLPTLLGQLGSMTLSFLGSIVLLVLLITTIVYVLLNPQPLLTFYLRLFPKRNRGAAERAYRTGADAAIAWMWSNVIIGSAEAIAATAFLTFMGVPGAVVWGALTFFAELIPKIGGYLMAVPPVLVAFAVDPMTAVWTAIFYVVMQTVAGDIIAPKIRSDAMRLHPAYLVIMMLAMGSAFGIPGAILATPIAGFVSAFMEEFFVKRQPYDDSLDKRSTRMLASHDTSDEQEK